MLRNFLFLFILPILCLTTVIGQNCHCITYDDRSSEIEDELTLGDSVTFKQSIKQVDLSSQGFCQFMTDFLLLKFKVKNHQFGSWEKDFKALELDAQKYKCSEIPGLLLHVKSEYYQESDQIEPAIANAFELMKWADKSKDPEVSLQAISIIVSIYARQNQDDKVIPYVRSAAKLIEKVKDEKSKALYYNWLSRNYETFYTLSETASQLDSAELFVNKAFEISKKYKLNRQLQLSFQIKEAIAYHRGNLRQSLAFHDSIYHYIKLNAAYQSIPLYFQMKSYTLVDMGKMEQALIHQDSAIYYARKYAQPSYLANYLKQGAELYEQAGLSIKAIACLKEQMTIRDSVQTAKRSEIVTELEQKYEKEKNEKTILLLNHQRNILWAGLGLLLMTCGLIYLFYRQKVMKRDQLILETEQRLNRARMNPHFFFNALASLQSFALNEPDSMAVAENLSKFSHIMRETLENTYREYNSVQHEIDFMTEYLELQQMRFPGKFDFEISNQISDPNSMLIPSMIVQPFVENSIEHGFADLQYKGHLTLSFSKDELHTYVTITDNGRGFNTQSAQAKPYVSRASQIIKDRIYLLNLKLKSDAQFKIESDKTNGIGVRVYITLPVINED